MCVTDRKIFEVVGEVEIWKYDMAAVLTERIWRYEDGEFPG